MRQHVDFISAPHGEGIIIERDVPQQNFMFPFHARAAQKRLDVEQKLFAIKRRGQKIVYARTERLLAVGGRFLAGQHQNERLAADAAQRLGEF